MLEIPIPAGCSYAQNKARKHWRENHREYEKHQVITYIQDLPEGKMTLEIELEPRYTGRFNLNPAKAEMMYFPVLQANNAASKVSISE